MADWGTVVVAIAGVGGTVTAALVGLVATRRASDAAAVEAERQRQWDRDLTIRAEIIRLVVEMWRCWYVGIVPANHIADASEITLAEWSDFNNQAIQPMSVACTQMVQVLAPKGGITELMASLRSILRQVLMDGPGQSAVHWVAEPGPYAAKSVYQVLLNVEVAALAEIERLPRGSQSVGEVDGAA